jgi:hypothetical protein
MPEHYNIFMAGRKPRECGKEGRNLFEFNGFPYFLSGLGEAED